MNFQNITAVSVLSLIGLSAHGASTVTYDFDSEGAGDFFDGGVSGWTQSPNNQSAFGQIFPMAYIAEADFGNGISMAGHLGTHRGNTPDNTATTVSGTLNFLGVPAAPQVTLNLGILDGAADSFETRDSFTVALKSGDATTLAQINFAPTVGNTATWDVAVGIGGVTQDTGSKIATNGGYLFNINFGTNTEFWAGGAQGGAPQLLADVGFVDFSDLATIDLTHTPDPGSAPGASAHVLIFDNIVAASVPEPSGVALLLLGSAFLMGRRRS